MTETTLGPIDFSSLLDELESGSSGSCASVIRKLREYEVAAYEAGHGGPTGELIANFIARLDERVADKELEIEKTCSHNYQSFIESAQELMRMQERAQELQITLREIRANVIDNVDKLNASSEALTTTHATIERIDQCIAALRTSLPVLDQYERIEKSIAEGRYYHALKSLEYLEHYQLKSTQAYAFSRILAKRIPELRAEIKAASLAQLTDFLEDIRKHSIRLGAIAMHQTAEKLGMKEELEEVDPDPPKVPEKRPSRTVPQSPRSSSDCDDSDVEAPKPRNPPPPRPRDSQTSQRKTSGSTIRSNRSNVLEAELQELEEAAKTRGEVDDGIDALDGSSNWNSERNNIERLIDFGPVYRCLHIHTVSGERSEFEHYYFTQRRKQCQLILALSPSQQSSLRNYGEFFSRVVGFFLIDDYLRHSLPTAVTSGSGGSVVGSGGSGFYEAYLSEVWSGLVPRLSTLVIRNAQSCSKAADLVSLRRHCILFERTMASLGFHTAGLNEMIDAVRLQFSRLLIQQWKTRFEEIFATDNYTAIRLESPSDLTPELACYPYCQSAEFSASPYPRTLAFSPMVPRIYSAVRDYIDAAGAIVASPTATAGTAAWTEVEEALNRAVNVLFTDCLASLLSCAIEAAENDLLRLVQLTINLTELESACEHLQTHLHRHARPRLRRSEVEEAEEDALSALVGLEDADGEVQPSRSHLYGVALFRDSRARAETQIYTHLNTKIEEFCGLAAYEGVFGGPGCGLEAIAVDQLPEEVDPAMEGAKPSDYIVDLMAWLASTFAAFSHLPTKVAHTACISACKNVVKCMQRIFVGPDVKMVWEPALTQGLIDVGECERFARSNPVPGIDTGILLLIFSELRQLLRLVRDADWDVFFANHGSRRGSVKQTGGSGGENPYDRVTPAAALALLERVREADKRRHAGVGAAAAAFLTKRPGRDRRRRLDDVVKQLKSPAFSSGSRR